MQKMVRRKILKLFLLR